MSFNAPLWRHDFGVGKALHAKSKISSSNASWNDHNTALVPLVVHSEAVGDDVLMNAIDCQARCVNSLTRRPWCK
eukprot:5612417-Pyramimonas_sp.AAC.1